MKQLLNILSIKKNIVLNYTGGIANGFVFLILISFSCNSSAQNIALQAKYTLSKQPNYYLSTPSNDSTSLTDGIYSSGVSKFWKQRTTVGWQTTDPVKIIIDLGRTKPIGTISFNTVRSIREGVNFPANVFVFTSFDQHHLWYAGDAAYDYDNRPGSYLIKQFNLKVNANARYVYLIVIPEGHLIFCDEIEISGSKKNMNFPIRIGKPIDADSLNEAVDSLKKAWTTGRVTQRNIVDLQDMIAVDNSENTQTESYIGGELNSLNQKIDSKTNNEVLNLFASALRKKYSGNFLLRTINPWDTLHPIYTPAKNKESSYPVNTLINGVQYAGFTITNISSKAQQITCSIQPANIQIADIKLFSSPFITDNNSIQLPDPLIQIEVNGMKLKPGETRLFIWEITGRKAGSTQAIFTANTVNSKQQIPVNITVSSIVIPETRLDLNAIDWGYMYFKLINDRQSEAVADQLNHHINTIVIPPWIVPKIGGKDFQELKTYLSLHKGATNILLFVNYAAKDNLEPPGVGSFMSLLWKQTFVNWYQNVQNAVNESGFSSDHLFLYPFDEVKGSDISNFKTLATWAKTGVPGLKIYATFDNKAAIQQLMPLTDVAQVKDDPELLNNLPIQHNQIWIYSLFKFSKSVSPYTSFRLMAWRAFENDYAGIGFWSYADIGKIALMDVPAENLMAREDDYSVIYRGHDKTLISSRRWEAFKLGIEDYQLLILYAKKKGMREAKKLASMVLNNPQNFTYADSIRKQVIKELSK